MQRLRPWLFVGKHRETLLPARLVAGGARALLHLAEQVPSGPLLARTILLEDGAPLSPTDLDACLAFVQQCYDQSLPLVIVCGAGVSRSPTVAIAALVEIEGLALADAARIVRTLHPDAMPHPALWQSLCERYTSPIPYIELIRYGGV